MWCNTVDAANLCYNGGCLGVVSTRMSVSSATSCAFTTSRSCQEVIVGDAYITADGQVSLMGCVWHGTTTTGRDRVSGILGELLMKGQKVSLTMR